MLYARRNNNNYLDIVAVVAVATIAVAAFAIVAIAVAAFDIFAVAAAAIAIVVHDVAAKNHVLITGKNRISDSYTRSIVAKS